MILGILSGIILFGVCTATLTNGSGKHQNNININAQKGINNKMSNNKNTKNKNNIQMQTIPLDNDFEGRSNTNIIPILIEEMNDYDKIGVDEWNENETNNWLNTIDDNEFESIKKWIKKNELTGIDLMELQETACPYRYRFFINFVGFT